MTRKGNDGRFDSLIANSVEFGILGPVAVDCLLPGTDGGVVAGGHEEVACRTELFIV